MVEYKTLKSLIRDAEDTIKKWENRGNVSFYSRPRFEPSITNEELNDYIEQLNKLEKEVVEPKLIDGSDNMFRGYDDYIESDSDDMRSDYNDEETN